MQRTDRSGALPSDGRAEADRDVRGAQARGAEHIKIQTADQVHEGRDRWSDLDGYRGWHDQGHSRSFQSGTRY